MGGWGGFLWGDGKIGGWRWVFLLLEPVVGGLEDLFFCGYSGRKSETTL